MDVGCGGKLSNGRTEARTEVRAPSLSRVSFVSAGTRFGSGRQPSNRVFAKVFEDVLDGSARLIWGVAFVQRSKLLDPRGSIVLREFLHPGQSGFRLTPNPDRDVFSVRRQIHEFGKLGLAFAQILDHMEEWAARARALPCLKFSLGSAMAGASREKAVETASYRTTSP